jgi:hypothetical protein
MFSESVTSRSLYKAWQWISQETVHTFAICGYCKKKIFLRIWNGNFTSRSLTILTDLINKNPYFEISPNLIRHVEDAYQCSEGKVKVRPRALCIYHVKQMSLLLTVEWSERCSFFRSSSVPQYVVHKRCAVIKSNIASDFQYSAFCAMRILENVPRA